MSDVEYPVMLCPSRGDGRLTEQDVVTATYGIPRGAAVVVEVDECDDFAPGAPGRLARVLSGCVVRHQFGPNARRIGEHWVAAYDRASAEFLDVEARLLGRLTS